MESFKKQKIPRIPVSLEDSLSVMKEYLRNTCYRISLSNLKDARKTREQENKKKMANFNNSEQKPV